MDSIGDALKPGDFLILEECQRLEAALDCEFQTNLDSDSKRTWTLIPRQSGHRFQSKLDSQM
jgi:hypothetical protein